MAGLTGMFQSSNSKSKQQLSPEAHSIQQILSRMILGNLGQGAPQGYGDFLHGGLRAPVTPTLSLEDQLALDPYSVSPDLQKMTRAISPSGMYTVGAGGGGKYGMITNSVGDQQKMQDNVFKLLQYNMPLLQQTAAQSGKPLTLQEHLPGPSLLDQFLHNLNPMNALNPKNSLLNPTNMVHMMNPMNGPLNPTRNPMDMNIPGGPNIQSTKGRTINTTPRKK